MYPALLDDVAPMVGQAGNSAFRLGTAPNPGAGAG